MDVTKAAEEIVKLAPFTQQDKDEIENILDELWESAYDAGAWTEAETRLMEE